MNLNSLVDYGEVSRTKANAPHDARPQRKIIIEPRDGHGVQKGATGWYRWHVDEHWYHLGGNSIKTPTIYILSLIQKKKEPSGTPPEWRWSKAKDQTDASALYIEHGQQ